MNPARDLLDVPCPECGDFDCVVRTGEESARCEKCGADLVATHFVVIPKRVEEEFFRG